MNIADESSQDISPTRNDSVTCASAEPSCAEWTFSPEAIRARKTPTLADLLKQSTRLLEANFSELLSGFARRLWYEKILQLSEQMPLGLGGSSATNLSGLVTQCCPFDFGRVALGLTSGETACSCSPNFRAPNARDWKGMSAKSWRERTTGDPTPTLPDQIGGVPRPEFVEALLGFPIGWTDLEHLETACPSRRRVDRPANSRKLRCLTPVGRRRSKDGESTHATDRP